MSRYLFVDPGVQWLLRDAVRNVGGASVQALQWMKGLAADGHDVACLAGDPIETATPFTVFDGYDPAGGPGYLTRQAPFLASVLRRYRPRYVYQGAAGMITPLLAALAPRFGARFIHRLANDADVERGGRGRFGAVKGELYRFGLRAAGAILCQNDHQLGVVTREFPGRPALRIGNPISLADVPPDLRESEGAYVAWIGTFVYQKNLPAAVRLAAALPDVSFRFAGALPPSRRNVDPATRGAVEEMARLPNAEHVGLLPRSEIPGFLAGAHALLSTSRFEGFPNTFLEAWSVGTPVVTTRAADPDDVVARHGLGEAAEDPAELLGPLERTVAHGRGGEVGERCVRYLRDHHDAPVLARRLDGWLGESRP